MVRLPSEEMVSAVLERVIRQSPRGKPAIATAGCEVSGVWRRTRLMSKYL